VSWQIYEKTRERKASDPIMTISKKFGRFAFNSSAAEIMRKNAMETVLVMWDPENLQIGIRNVMKKDARAYTLHFAKKQYGASFGARSFLNYIGYDYSVTRNFPCKWNEQDGIFVVQLTKEALANKSGQRVAKMPVSRSKGPETGNMKAQAI
jgi:hypothetical protein